MAKRTIKTWRKMLSSAAAPQGWKPEEWRALREAHAAGAVLYGTPSVWTFDGRDWKPEGAVVVQLHQVAPVVAAPPLQLERGCSRCGEPLPAKRKVDTCAPCAKEMRAKAKAEPQEQPVATVEALPVPAAALAAAESALRDWDAREAMARTFQPERAEYEKSGAGEERTVICLNPFAALNALEGR